MTTRDKILNETLTLFSENGFDGTSVEQIAEKVGIKAPSLYNHFKGKEDILNALIDTAEARYEESFGSEKHFGKLPHSRDAFIAIAMKKVEFTVFDPIIGKSENSLFVSSSEASALPKSPHATKSAVFKRCTPKSSKI